MPLGLDLIALLSIDDYRINLIPGMQSQEIPITVCQVAICQPCHLTELHPASAGVCLGRSSNSQSQHSFHSQNGGDILWVHTSEIFVFVRKVCITLLLLNSISTSMSSLSSCWVVKMPSRLSCMSTLQ